MKLGRVIAAVLLLSGTGFAQGLSISHDAIPFAVRGQPLTLKAKVGGAEEPEAVTLYYALFRDAAPFRVPMKATGLGYYVGTIESSVVSGVDSFSYYIEAQDKNGAITETPWYEVPIRKAESKNESAPAASAGLPMPRPAGPAAPAPVMAASVEHQAKPDSREGSWKTPALIAGGAAVVLGGAYAISEGGGSSGGSDDDNDGGGGEEPADPQGTYGGSVNTCLTSTGGVTTCDSGAMTIVIDVNKVVFSETLRPGQQLTGNLNNGSFNLVSVSSEGGTNSTINFEGNVVGNKILGSVSGSTSDGGSYSGSFSANKQ